MPLHHILIRVYRPIDLLQLNTEVNVIDTTMALAVDRSRLLLLLLPPKTLLVRVSERNDRRTRTGVTSAGTETVVAIEAGKSDHSISTET